MHSPGITNLVFLGGSCNPTTWRSEVAIPFLRKVQVNYYNPQVAQWTPELIEEENRAKTNAGVLLFVIDNLTRSVSALIELAELAAGNRILVCVLKQFIQPEARIGGQIISAREYHDLRHAQTVVKRLMERRGVPVFADLPEALAYTADLIKTQRSTDELIRRYATAYRSGLLKAPMKLVRLREIFRSLDVGNNGEIRMYDVQYAYRLITGRSIDEHTIRTVIFYQLRCSDNYVISENNHDLRLNFEQFCCLLAIYEHQQQADCCTNASSNTTTVPAMRSNGKLRPLQWIFDWFSGVHSRIDENHHHHHDHHHNSPASISAKDDALSIGTRSRTPISRLDSVQSVYCNQNVRNSMNDLHQPNSYPSLVIGGTILHQQQSNKTDALNMRHLYPFQAECRDVYLGGTGLPSRWREEIAIPILRYVDRSFIQLA